MPPRFRLPATLPAYGRRASVALPKTVSAPALAPVAVRLASRPLSSSCPRPQNAPRTDSHNYPLEAPWEELGDKRMVVQATEDTLIITDPKSRKTQTLPNIWLRDSCRCKVCVNADTSQRNFSINDLDNRIYVKKAEPTKEGLNVAWSGDDHRSFYSWDFLNFYRDNNHRSPEPVKTEFWGRSLEESLPTVSFDDVMDTSSDVGIGKLTALIRRYGIVFVENTPYDDPIHTKHLLERIAFIRETHYGGFYDFKPDLAMADTAYTNLALPPHTDTTYFTEPAGLQAFHMLSHEPPPPIEGEEQHGSEPETLGGESSFVDGFHAAEILRRDHPDAFDILSNYRVPWHASGNKGITIAPDRRYPVLELLNDHDREVAGKVVVPLGDRQHRDNNTRSSMVRVDNPNARVHRIRWNNDDRGILPLRTELQATVNWYRAAQTWNELLQTRQVKLWTQLQPGKPVIFDNWRVLHGRRAFLGVRRMCGGYTARDDFISRWRNTNYSREDVLSQIVG